MMFPIGSDLEDEKIRFAADRLAIFHWMTENCLQLNPSKTEIMLLGKASTIWTQEWWPDQLGMAPFPNQDVINLGLKLDPTLTMKDHVEATIRSCYYSLRLSRRILPYLPIDHRRTLVQAMVMSRLDYGNALLAEVGETLLAKLQVIQNTADRMILNRPPGSSLVQTAALVTN